MGEELDLAEYQSSMLTSLFHVILLRCLSLSALFPWERECFLLKPVSPLPIYLIAFLLSLKSDEWPPYYHNSSIDVITRSDTNTIAEGHMLVSTYSYKWVYELSFSLWHNPGFFLFETHNVLLQDVSKYKNHRAHRTQCMTISSKCTVMWCHLVMSWGSTKIILRDIFTWHEIQYLTCIYSWISVLQSWQKY